MLSIPEPSQKISPKAITVWRIRDAIYSLVTLTIIGTLIYLSYYFEWFQWIQVILSVIFTYRVLNTIYKLTIHPVYLQKTWRYEIDPNYIQLKYGYFHRTHTLIPMSRIEYVNTNQGPLLRKFDLASLTFGTVTSSHDIPAISIDEAKRLREKIAQFAQIEQNDVDEVESEHDE